MKKILTTLLLISSSQLEAKIELLDRIAIIVDDGVVMESQINKAREALEEGYREQNIQLPPKDILLDQIKERLIIEELQLQLADRAGVKISDAELNSSFSRLAANNEMTLEEFISFIESNGDSYEEVRETMRKEMRIQRIQRGRVNSNIEITEKEFEDRKDYYCDKAESGTPILVKKYNGAKMLVVPTNPDDLTYDYLRDHDDAY